MTAPLVQSTQGHDTHSVRAGDFHFRVTEYRGGMMFPDHCHEHAKVSNAIRGSYTETFGRRGVSCDSDTVIVKPPGVSHTDVYDSPLTVCLTVDVSPKAVELTREVSSLFRDVASTRMRTPLISRIMNEIEAPDPVTPFVLEGLALELIATVARATEPAVQEYAAFRQACEYLEAHARSGLELSAVASAAGVEPIHLARLFRMHAGCSPGSWLRARRLDQAKHMLRHTDSSLADIALDLGFYDQSHFTNVFRRNEGLTPARYRRLHGR